MHPDTDLCPPILEHDPDRSALIEPVSTQEQVDAPEAAVACLFPELIQDWTKAGIPLLDLPGNERLWEIDYRGRRLALFYPGMGAPLAAARLERVIAAGCTSVVACGAGGALRPGLTMGHHVITVTSAIRDEGTSYHYVPASVEIAVDPAVVSVLSTVATTRGHPHLLGRTWTTDAWFRETARRVARRRSQGCITVEMESAALIAVAQFRGIKFGQYLYAGDDLTGTTWNHRSWWESPQREQLVVLASIAALELVAGRQSTGTKSGASRPSRRI